MAPEEHKAPEGEIGELAEEARRQAARLERRVRAAGQVFHPSVTPEKRRERVRLAKAFLASFDGGRAA